MGVLFETLSDEVGDVFFARGCGGVIDSVVLEGADEPSEIHMWKELLGCICGLIVCFVTTTEKGSDDCELGWSDCSGS